MDAEKVKNTFSNLYFKLFQDKIHQGSNRQQLQQLLEAFVEDDAQHQYECSVVVIMSHGENDCIYTLNKTRFPISDIDLSYVE